MKTINMNDIRDILESFTTINNGEIDFKFTLEELKKYLKV
jgi:hypothetical protein